MKLNASLGLALTAVCSGTVWGCGSGGNQLSPLSPSPVALSLAARPVPGASSAELTSRPRQLDEDGDGYEDPVPAPTQVPPATDPASVPLQLTVNITGTFGPAAFAPNPLQAVIGNTIVWVNGDVIAHHIVLDDGTPVGNLAPGQSSLPLLLNVAVAGYHCTFHPSMVGQVTTTMSPPGAPPDPSAPAPGDPYDDGYEDDYYLKAAT
jgi:plastocyanin